MIDYFKNVLRVARCSQQDLNVPRMGASLSGRRRRNGRIRRRKMAGTNSDESERVFQGTNLVTALIEHYPRCFHSRGDAEAFAQRLLETGHLTSIHTEDAKFQDNAFYYRWSNESLFDDITQYSNNIIADLHIPEKRLSDLVATEMDRERGDGGYPQRRYNSVGDSDDDFRSSTPRTMALRSQYQESSLSINDISNIPNRDDSTHGQRWDTPIRDRNQNYYQEKRGAFRKLDFDKMQQENERLRNSSMVQPNFDNGPNRPLSEYEKYLLDEMKRMQHEHGKVVNSYEGRISELMSKMHELRNIAELLEQSGKSNPTSPWHSQEQLNRDRPQNGRLTPEGMLTKVESETAHKRPPPPVPAPPPMAKKVEPSKPPMKPKVKMRQLFWNRLILPKKNKHKKTIWQDISEAHVDFEEIEKLFGKQDKKSDSGRNRQSHADREKRKSWAKFEGAKILEQNRSRTVAIKMRSMHCQLDEIKTALYNMEFNTVSIESLQGLYQIRATDEEIQKIEHYLRSDGLIPLDEPEQFLYEVSRICHFKERLGTVVFMSKFNESMFNMDQQLLSMQDACQMLTKTSALKTILELVLTCGNYMNGGTHRGQADGFQLEFLNKIKDVKSVQNNLNLLQFIIKIYCREYEEDAGQNTAQFRLPDPVIIRQAAQVSLSEIFTELGKMQDKLQIHREMADTIARETPRNLVQPFKDKMTDYFTSAEETLKRQNKKLQETVRMFQETTNYLVCDDMVIMAKNNIPVTDKFMGTWFTFLVDCKHYWKLQQKAIAKENFERVERRKRERKASVVRVSTSERNLSRLERRTSLKEKFQKKMVDSDGRASQVKEMYKRGDTPVQLGYDSRVSSMASLTNGRSETPNVIKEETPQKPEPESAFQPFQRTSALRSSLQARRRRQQEAEMVPHVAEANPNVELKEPMSMRDTLTGKNAVWSERPTVQEQDVPVARVSAPAVIHQEAPNMHQTQTSNAKLEMSSRGREMSPAIRRRRAASPPQEPRRRELSPQGGNRREMSPPPPVGTRRHRSPPVPPKPDQLSPRDNLAAEHRRDRTPNRGERRREISPPASQSDRRRELSPGGASRRRELSPAQPDRRREMSPNNRLPPRRDMSPPQRSPRQHSTVNGSVEDVPPPIPRRERSPANRRDLSPQGQRTREQQPGQRQRRRERSPPQENRREISPPPVVRRRDQSPAVSSIPVRRRDPSPAHAQRQRERGQAASERGRTMSPGRQDPTEAQEAQRLRAAAERYTAPTRRSMSPPENNQGRHSRRLPETPYQKQATDYQNSPPHNAARVDSPSPPPVPPLPPDIEEQISRKQYDNNMANRPELRSPVETPETNTDRYLGRAVPISERQLQEKQPARAVSPRVIMATTVNERLSKYENKIKRTNSLRLESLSQRPDVTSRPRNRAPILDNLRQLEEKLQTEISQRDTRVAETDYAQPSIRSRRYAAKLVRSPAENGGDADAHAQEQPAEANYGTSRRRRPNSYHSLEGSHLLSQFEPQTQQQYNNPTPSSPNNPGPEPQGQYEYQNALRNASMKYGQASRPGKT